MGWWLERACASTGTCSMKASCSVKPSSSGFIFEGTAPRGGRFLGLFLELISIGFVLEVVVTQAKCRNLACFRASDGCSAREALLEAIVGPTQASLFAQTTWKASAEWRRCGESGRPRPILLQFVSTALIHSFLLSKNMAMSRAVGGFCPPNVIQMNKTAIVMITRTIGSVDSLDKALIMASSSK